jgi:kumamolisin
VPSPKSKRISLPASQKSPLKGAKITGPVKASEQIEVTLRLRRRASTPEAESARSSGEVITHAEFERLFGADPADLHAIESFAHDHGLTVIEANASERKIRLSGVADDMSAAFGTALNYYSAGKAKYIGRTGKLSLPAEIHPMIEAVFGLDNRKQAHAHFRLRTEAVAKGKGKVAPRAAKASTSFTPPQVAALYSFPSQFNGAGQTIGIIELGGGYRTTDLKAYFKSLKLTSPTVTAVSVDGARNSPTLDPNGPDGEVALDIEVAGAMAPGARQAVYFAPNTDAGFLDALTTAIHDQIRKPGVISISWGAAESEWTAQAVQDFDNACADAALLGVTVCVAAGDNGYTDSSDVAVKTANVDFPSSSPNVLACGGTRLSGRGSQIADEVVWNELTNGEGATGGGLSNFFPVPDFQSGLKLPASLNAGGKSGRGVPDVCGNADPASGFSILVDGHKGVIGGTSAVAPLWAALIAVLNQGIGRPVGFLTPLLYKIPASAKAFHDIVSGCNGPGQDGYPAGTGWDACTGLGSPDGAALLAAIPEVKKASTQSSQAHA